MYLYVIRIYGIRPLMSERSTCTSVCLVVLFNLLKYILLLIYETNSSKLITVSNSIQYLHFLNSSLLQGAATR